MHAIARGETAWPRLAQYSLSLSPPLFLFLFLFLVLACAQEYTTKTRTKIVLWGMARRGTKIYLVERADLEIDRESLLGAGKTCQASTLFARTYRPWNTWYSCPCLFWRRYLVGRKRNVEKKSSTERKKIDWVKIFLLFRNSLEERISIRRFSIEPFL